MKMKKFVILSVCALGALASGLTACGNGPDKVKDFVGEMKTSVNSVVTVDVNVEIADGGTVVYAFTRHMAIDCETQSAIVTDVKTTLSTNYEFTTSTSTSTAQGVTGETLVRFNLSEKLVSAYEIKDGNLTCTVSRDKISRVLPGTVSASSDMELFIGSEDGNLKKAEYSYVNTSSRTVNVTVTYGY